MSDECLFCKIVRGQIPSHKVHEDAHVLAFLDIHPLRKGHTLVIPKAHRVLFEDLSSQEASQLASAAQVVAGRVTKAVGATASTIAINNGRDAGQEVPHVHVHIVPRTHGDGAGPIHALFSKRPEVTPADLASLAQKLQAAKPAR